MLDIRKTSGTHNNPICVFAFPDDFEDGNVPILDCDKVYRTSGMWVRDVNYWNFKGLTVCNARQDGRVDDVRGLVATNAKYINFYQIVAHSNGGCGFLTEGKSIVYFYNCDAYNNVDSIAVAPSKIGGAGDGFQTVGTWDSDTAQWTRAYYIGCRAWDNSDDGFESVYGCITYFNSCWAISNGKLDGDGRGITVGIMVTDPPPEQHIIQNCISVYNKSHGFRINCNGDPAHTDGRWYNNIAAYNGLYGFKGQIGTGNMNTNIFRNNIAYNNPTDWIMEWDEIITNDHNSFDIPINLSDSDFLSVDTTGMTSKRDIDGSLPNIDLFKPAIGSQLIDAGKPVGLPYNGDAPDLGPWETGTHRIMITSPGDGSILTAPADISVTTEVSGEVRNVVFFDGETKIGEATSTPWTFTWYDVPVGDHTLTAVAYDYINAVSKSQLLTVKVRPTITLLYPNPNNGRFTLSLIENLEQVAGIYIYSFEGKLVYSGIIQAEEKSKDFDLFYINTGLYTLMIISKNMTYAIKFIKE